MTDHDVSQPKNADPDYYEVLEISSDASTGAVNEAYKTKAKILHPDKDTGDADAFALLGRAWNTLRNPARRAVYDATGEDIPEPPPEDVDRHALALLSRYIANLMVEKRFDPLKVDVKLVLLRELDMEIAKSRDTVEQCDTAMKRAEKMVKKFRRRGQADGGSRFDGILSNYIRAIRAEKQRHTLNLRARECARGIVLDHDYEADVMQQIGGYTDGPLEAPLNGL